VAPGAMGLKIMGLIDSKTATESIAMAIARRAGVTVTTTMRVAVARAAAAVASRFLIAIGGLRRCPACCARRGGS
jgi:polysaccharide deacetylase 2 family uncharacterized protein YibQ